MFAFKFQKSLLINVYSAPQDCNEKITKVNNLEYFRKKSVLFKVTIPNIDATCFSLISFNGSFFIPEKCVFQVAHLFTEHFFKDLYNGNTEKKVVFVSILTF